MHLKVHKGFVFINNGCEYELRHLSSSYSSKKLIIRGKLFLFYFLLVFVGIAVSGEELPKRGFGKYGGEIPAYEVYVDGQPLSISSHDISISIFADKVIYSNAHLELSGAYTVFKQGKNDYVVKAQSSNGKSVNYAIEFTRSEKQNMIYLSVRNGQAAAVLERMFA